VKRVLVLGYFGLSVNQLDGQTIKTRSVHALLKSRENEIEYLECFDTQQFKYSVFSPLKMIWKIFQSNIIVYIPAHNNLKYLFPFIYLISKLKRIDILYVVVGGWLAEYLQKKKFHINLLSNIKGIFPQTNQLSNILREQYHFNNIVYFPNFRIHSFVPSFAQREDDVFKIVFMARIIKLKGVDTIFRLANHLKDFNKNCHKIIIDFYGPIPKEEKDYFYKEIENLDFVSYKGILEPEQIHSMLNKYDLLVLPTRYPGEGFPGTILDAYISGIPVVASKWKYIPEFVDHGNTGFLYDLNKEDELYGFVEKLFEDRTLLLKMKRNAFEKSKEFSSESAWHIIKSYLVN
jgi:glycosyltransferase involved in cell wall biosynthesis